MFRPFMVAMTAFFVTGSWVAAGPQAGSEPRLWKDATGKFQVRAILVEQTDTAVRLHTADGREIAVPIEKLSQADKDYLQSLPAPVEDPFAGGMKLAPGDAMQGAPTPRETEAGTLRALPESASAGDEMALPGSGTTLDLASAPTDAPFVCDPLPAVSEIPQGLVAVSAVDAYDKIATPVLVDASQGRFLVSIGRNKSGSPQETRGRIYVVDLAGKQSQLVWDQPRAVQVVDHDAATGRSLIVDNLDQFQRGGELVMVEGLTSGSPRVLYRRSLPGAGKPGFAPQVEWCRLVSGSHAAAIVDGILHVWDLAAATLLYRVEGMAASEPPAFSGSQRYMAVPQSGSAVIVETATGEIRRVISTGSTLKPGVAFDANGRLLALSFSNQYRVWDCEQDTVVSEATTTDHLGSHPLWWLTPRLFRTPLGSTVDIELGMSVWKYTTSVSTEPIVVGGKLVTAMTSTQCDLASVAIPHAAAKEAVEKLMRSGDAAMLVRPGSQVALAIEASAPVDQEEVRSALAEAAERAGWEVAKRAPITLVAKIGRGATEQLSFRSMHGGPAATSTANLTPFTAELEIRRGATVLWSRATVNRVPPILHLQEGETVQDAVLRFEKPDAAFFARLNLPPRIPKPDVTAQIGMSVLKDGQWQDLPTTGTPPRRRR